MGWRQREDKESLFELFVCVWRCLDGDTARRFPHKYTGLSLKGGEKKEDNEACGEAAAAAAVSVCDIEPHGGRTLSAAFHFLAIYLFISFFTCLHQRQNNSLRSMLNEGAGLNVVDCQAAAVTLDDEGA